MPRPYMKIIVISLLFVGSNYLSYDLGYVDLELLAAAAPEILAQRLDPVTEFVVSKSRAEEQTKPK